MITRRHPRPDVLVVEEGRPDPREVKGRQVVISGDTTVTRHATNVLRALSEYAGPEVRIRWHSLPRGAAPAEWLAAMGESSAAGARICSMSFGKARLDGHGLWDQLGTGIRDRVAAGTTFVAPVGNQSASHLDGHDVLIPASHPAVIAVSGVVSVPHGEWSAFPLNRDRAVSSPAAAVCECADAPDGTAAGTSFAAPRVAGLLARAVQPVPERLIRPEFCRALLLAASRLPCPDPLGEVVDHPAIGRSLGFGAPSAELLHAMVECRHYQVGIGPAAIVARRHGTTPRARLVVASSALHRLAVRPAGGGRGPAARPVWQFQADGVVAMEFDAQQPPILRVDAPGPWAAAWSPL